MGLTPSCMKSDKTTLTISSSCFEKKVKIILDNENEEHNEILDILMTKIKEKRKQSIKNKTHIIDV